ncbi:MAG: hypothetical protein ACREXT_08915 [Gammaproteobacteria bacterium]
MSNMAQSNTASIVTNLNVHDYFHAQLAASISHQHVALDPVTVNYLAKMLTSFTDPQQLFSRTPEGWDLKPLAMHYADAVYAEGNNQRKFALQRLGDIALFIAGMFAGSLARKLVDVDYYVAMGSAAYRYLHEIVNNALAHRPIGVPYAELGTKFAALVDVLAEVADEAHLGQRTDVLRDYEIWLRTDSARALDKLRRYGLQPCRTAGSFTRH